MNILVLVANSFPYGVAISSRFRNFCQLFVHCGNKVHVLALRNDNSNCPLGQAIPLEGYTYQVLTHHVPSALATYTGDNAMIDGLRAYLRLNGKPDLVFAASIEPYFNRIVRLLGNTPIMVEQCEWMDDSSYRFGKLDYRRLRRDRLLHGGYKKAAGVVSISRLLDEHYRSLGIPSIRIPTIIDVQNTDFTTQTDNERLTIVYTGNPSTSKELFRPVFEAIRDHELLRQRVCFHIYGPNAQKVLANIGGDTALMNAVQDNVVVHGRVPQEQIPDILRHADFQLFLRPSRRSSNAGFPTKFAESMAVGTPVLTKDTGDICLYLSDGENGILSQGITSKATAEALLRAVAMSQEERYTMRKAARQTAEQAFDFRCYCDQMTDFLNALH